MLGQLVDASTALEETATTGHVTLQSFDWLLYCLCDESQWQ